MYRHNADAINLYCTLILSKISGKKKNIFSLSTCCFLLYMEHVFSIKKISCSHVFHLGTIHNFVVVRLVEYNNPAYSWSFGIGFHIHPHKHHYFQNFCKTASLFGLIGAKFSQKLFYTISKNKNKVICFMQLFSPNNS